jgi:hypothetical protein
MALVAGSQKVSDFPELEGVVGVEESIEVQKEKLEKLRQDVRTLEFKKIDVAGNYASITYKAFDGGKMGVRFDPFELNVIDVADSNGRRKVRFIVPELESYADDDPVVKDVTDKLDAIPEIKKLVKLLNQTSIQDISYILKDSSTLMEIAEWACIFDRLTADSQEPIIILKDGLLRTKFIRSDKAAANFKILRGIIKDKKEDAKLVGVSKTSAVISLLSTALFIEKKIPANSVGYIKVPLELEVSAYHWTGRGKVDKTNVKPLSFALGELYIAKLAKNSNLLVTIEIPKDLEADKPIYTQEEVIEILSYLAKDSKTSYPIVGYPQTIMRAHETAVRLGFPASLLRDELLVKILENLDPEAKDFVRDGWLLRDSVDKGVLGGGGYA